MRTAGPRRAAAAALSAAAAACHCPGFQALHPHLHFWVGVCKRHRHPVVLRRGRGREAQQGGEQWERCSCGVSAGGKPPAAARAQRPASGSRPRQRLLERPDPPLPAHRQASQPSASPCCLRPCGWGSWARSPSARPAGSEGHPAGEPRLQHWQQCLGAAGHPRSRRQPDHHQPRGGASQTAGCERCEPAVRRRPSHPAAHNDELELVLAGRQVAREHEAVRVARVGRHVQLLAPAHVQARHLAWGCGLAVCGVGAERADQASDWGRGHRPAVMQAAPRAPAVVLRSALTRLHTQPPGNAARPRTRARPAAPAARPQCRSGAGGWTQGWAARHTARLPPPRGWRWRWACRCGCLRAGRRSGGVQ